ncbi:hypothetical protein AB6A40_007607 [Gnathostoma spinigerum]|uniref:CMP/dCMP-type deaminase domain-containing protein n=1 Tax=Gnathostoma spinigerum TaxID=75299 RepID=A0ABD6ELZ5_9BILA
METNGGEINENDKKFMERAFELAEEALKSAEVPVGCILVLNGEEVACGRNDVNRSKNPTNHAEMKMIEQLKLWCTQHKKTLTEVFQEATLYVTLEPCIMCACALYHLKIKRIVYGAANERFGGIHSVGGREKYASDHEIEVICGLDKERSVQMLKNFYDTENPFCPEEKRRHRTKQSTCIPRRAWWSWWTYCLWHFTYAVIG